MRYLIVFSHPVATSFSAAVCARAADALRKAGHEVRVLDLYAEGFEPVLSRDEWLAYHTPGVNEAPVADQIAHIRWAEALVFVYPTWWFGLPAMLKGWLDRVWVPNVAFTMPGKAAPVVGQMSSIVRLVAITTSGATRFGLAVMGNPGRRTIMRGVRALCHRRCRTRWIAHYDIDQSTAQSRAAFLDRVERELFRP